MSYLIHIGFDNNCRLSRKVHYFEYKGIQFKLIQNNPRRWSDVLLTIIPNHNDEPAKEKAYITASEFLSALSWYNNARIKVEHLGGGSAKTGLRAARCHMFSFPRIPFGGLIVGYDITKIPLIENQEQKDALTLLREARSTNNHYLAFLFFWQILEVGKGDAIGWIDKMLRKKPHKLWVSDDEISNLPLGGKSLGKYFYDDCRCAISHLFRVKGAKRRIVIDTPEDNLRIIRSCRVLEKFAKFYIEDTLKLNKSMYLVRRNGKGFPVYLTSDETQKVRCKIAYRPQYLVRAQKIQKTDGRIN